MTWFLFALGVGAALGLLVWARIRVSSLRPLPEAVPSRSISELGTGRYRVVGRVVGIQTTPSPLDEVPCVFVEHAEYQPVGSDLVPLMRETEHGTVAHPFYLDDGTGRLRVDPGEALVEAVTVFEDAGLSAERRLRDGEEVELVATFGPSAGEHGGGPYRAGQQAWAPIADDCGPPRISYRTAPNMVMPADETTAFLRGAGVLLLVVSTFFGTLTLF